MAAVSGPSMAKYLSSFSKAQILPTVRCGCCSSKSPRYDKPSLKVKRTVKDVSATSAGQRQVTPNYSVSLEGSTSVCLLFKDQERVRSEE